ncbi:hypothetical protein DIPPA_52574 [Diplonema papillatum]|nr:hypothetical protein DIPPA_52574 [Diplonema papillatum]
MPATERGTFRALPASLDPRVNGQRMGSPPAASSSNARQALESLRSSIMLGRDDTSPRAVLLHSADPATSGVAPGRYTPSQIPNSGKGHPPLQIPEAGGDLQRITGLVLHYKRKVDEADERFEDQHLEFLELQNRLDDSDGEKAQLVEKIQSLTELMQEVRDDATKVEASNKELRIANDELKAANDAAAEEIVSLNHELCDVRNAHLTEMNRLQDMLNRIHESKQQEVHLLQEEMKRIASASNSDWMEAVARCEAEHAARERSEDLLTMAESELCAMKNQLSQAECFLVTRDVSLFNMIESLERERIHAECEHSLRTTIEHSLRLPHNKQHRGLQQQACRALATATSRAQRQAAWLCLRLHASRNRNADVTAARKEVQEALDRYKRAEERAESAESRLHDLTLNFQEAAASLASAQTQFSCLKLESAAACERSNKNADRASQAETEAAELKEQADALRRQLNDAQRKLQRLEDKVAETESDLEANVCRADTAEDALSTERRDFEDAAHRAKRSEKQLVEVTRDLQETTERLEHTEEELSQLRRKALSQPSKDRLESLEAEVSSLTADIRKHEDTNRSTQRELDDVQVELRRALAERDVLEQKLASEHDRIGSQHQRVEHDLRDTLQKTTAEAHELRALLQESDATQRSARTDMQMLETQLQTLQRAFDLETNHLKQLLEEQMAEKGDHQAKASALEAELSRLQLRMSGDNASQSRLKAETISLQERLEHLDNLLSAEAANAASLQSDVAVLKSNNLRVMSENEEITNQLSEVLSDVGIELEDKNQIAGALCLLRDEIARMRGSTESTANALRSALENTLQAKSSGSTDLIHLAREVDKLVHALREQNASQAGQLTRAEQEMAEETARLADILGTDKTSSLSKLLDEVEQDATDLKELEALCRRHDEESKYALAALSRLPEIGEKNNALTLPEALACVEAEMKTYRQQVAEARIKLERLLNTRTEKTLPDFVSEGPEKSLMPLVEAVTQMTEELKTENLSNQKEVGAALQKLNFHLVREMPNLQEAVAATEQRFDAVDKQLQQELRRKEHMRQSLVVALTTSQGETDDDSIETVVVRVGEDLERSRSALIRVQSQVQNTLIPHLPDVNSDTSIEDVVEAAGRQLARIAQFERMESAAAEASELQTELSLSHSLARQVFAELLPAGLSCPLSELLKVAGQELSLFTDDVNRLEKSEERLKKELFDLNNEAGEFMSKNLKTDVHYDSAAKQLMFELGPLIADAQTAAEQKKQLEASSVDLKKRFAAILRPHVQDLPEASEHASFIELVEKAEGLLRNNAVEKEEKTCTEQRLRESREKVSRLEGEVGACRAYQRELLALEAIVQETLMPHLSGSEGSSSSEVLVMAGKVLCQSEEAVVTLSALLPTSVQPKADVSGLASQVEEYHDQLEDSAEELIELKRFLRKVDAEEEIRKQEAAKYVDISDGMSMTGVVQLLVERLGKAMLPNGTAQHTRERLLHLLSTVSTISQKSRTDMSIEEVLLLLEETVASSHKELMEKEAALVDSIESRHRLIEVINEVTDEPLDAETSLADVVEVVEDELSKLVERSKLRADNEKMKVIETENMVQQQLIEDLQDKIDDFDRTERSLAEEKDSADQNLESSQKQSEAEFVALKSKLKEAQGVISSVDGILTVLKGEGSSSGLHDNSAYRKVHVRLEELRGIIDSYSQIAGYSDAAAEQMCDKVLEKVGAVMGKEPSKRVRRSVLNAIKVSFAGGTEVELQEAILTAVCEPGTSPKPALREAVQHALHTAKTASAQVLLEAVVEKLRVAQDGHTLHPSAQTAVLEAIQASLASNSSEAELQSNILSAVKRTGGLMSRNELEMKAAVLHGARECRQQDMYESIMQAVRDSQLPELSEETQRTILEAIGESIARGADVKETQQIILKALRQEAPFTPQDENKLKAILEGVARCPAPAANDMYDSVAERLRLLQGGTDLSESSKKAVMEAVKLSLGQNCTDDELSYNIMRASAGRLLTPENAKTMSAIRGGIRSCHQEDMFETVMDKLRAVQGEEPSEETQQVVLQVVRASVRSNMSEKETHDNILRALQKACLLPPGDEQKVSKALLEGVREAGQPALHDLYDSIVKHLQQAAGQSLSRDAQKAILEALKVSLKQNHSDEEMQENILAAIQSVSPDATPVQAAVHEAIRASREQAIYESIGNNLRGIVKGNVPKETQNELLAAIQSFCRLGLPERELQNKVWHAVRKTSRLTVQDEGRVHAAVHKALRMNHLTSSSVHGLIVQKLETALGSKLSDFTKKAIFDSISSSLMQGFSDRELHRQVVQSVLESQEVSKVMMAIQDAVGASAVDGRTQMLPPGGRCGSEPAEEVITRLQLELTDARNTIRSLKLAVRSTNLGNLRAEVEELVPDAANMTTSTTEDVPEFLDVIAMGTSATILNPRAPTPLSRKVSLDSTLARAGLLPPPDSHTDDPSRRPLTPTWTLVADKDTKIAELETQVAHLQHIHEGHTRSLQKRNAECEEAVRSMKGGKLKATAATDALQSECERLRAQYNSAERQLALEEAKLRDLVCDDCRFHEVLLQLSASEKQYSFDYVKRLRGKTFKHVRQIEEEAKQDDEGGHSFENSAALGRMLLLMKSYWEEESAEVECLAEKNRKGYMCGNELSATSRSHELMKNTIVAELETAKKLLCSAYQKFGAASGGFAVQNVVQGTAAPVLIADTDAVFDFPVDQSAAACIGRMVKLQVGWWVSDTNSLPDEKSQHILLSGLQKVTEKAANAPRVQQWFDEGPPDAVAGDDVPVTLSTACAGLFNNTDPDTPLNLLLDLLQLPSSRLDNSPNTASILLYLSKTLADTVDADRMLFPQCSEVEVMILMMCTLSPVELDTLLGHENEVHRTSFKQQIDRVTKVCLRGGSLDAADMKWGPLARLLFAVLSRKNNVPDTVFRTILVSQAVAAEHLGLERGTAYGWASPVVCTSEAVPVTCPQEHHVALLFQINGLQAGACLPQCPKDIVLPSFSAFTVQSVKQQSSRNIEIVMDWLGQPAVSPSMLVTDSSIVKGLEMKAVGGRQTSVSLPVGKLAALLGEHFGLTNNAAIAKFEDTLSTERKRTGKLRLALGEALKGCEAAEENTVSASALRAKCSDFEAKKEEMERKMIEMQHEVQTLQQSLEAEAAVCKELDAARNNLQKQILQTQPRAPVVDALLELNSRLEIAKKTSREVAATFRGQHDKNRAAALLVASVDECCSKAKWFVNNVLSPQEKVVLSLKPSQSAKTVPDSKTERTRKKK